MAYVGGWRASAARWRPDGKLQRMACVGCPLASGWLEVAVQQHDHAGVQAAPLAAGVVQLTAAGVAETASMMVRVPQATRATSRSARTPTRRGCRAACYMRPGSCGYRMHIVMPSMAHPAARTSAPARASPWANPALPCLPAEFWGRPQGVVATVPESLPVGAGSRAGGWHASADGVRRLPAGRMGCVACPPGRMACGGCPPGGRMAGQVPLGRYFSRRRAISDTPRRSLSATTRLASSRSAGVSSPLASRKAGRLRACPRSFQIRPCSSFL